MENKSVNKAEEINNGILKKNYKKLMTQQNVQTPINYKNQILDYNNNNQMKKTNNFLSKNNINENKNGNIKKQEDTKKECNNKLTNQIKNNENIPLSIENNQAIQQKNPNKSKNSKNKNADINKKPSIDPNIFKQFLLITELEKRDKIMKLAHEKEKLNNENKELSKNIYSLDIEKEKLNEEKNKFFKERNKIIKDLRQKEQSLLEKEKDIQNQFEQKKNELKDLKLQLKQDKNKLIDEKEKINYDYNTKLNELENEYKNKEIMQDENNNMNIEKINREKEMIKQKEKEINELQNYYMNIKNNLDLKENELNNKEIELQNKEFNLNNKFNQLMEKEQDLENEKTNYEKNQTDANNFDLLNQDLANKEEKLKNKEYQLIYLEKTLKDKEGEIKNRENIIFNQENILNNKLNENNNEINKKEYELNSKLDELNKKEEHLNLLNKEIEDKNKILKELDNKYNNILENMNQEQQNIKNEQNENNNNNEDEEEYYDFDNYINNQSNSQQMKDENENNNVLNQNAPTFGNVPVKDEKIDRNENNMPNDIKENIYKSMDTMNYNNNEDLGEMGLDDLHDEDFDMKENANKNLNGQISIKKESSLKDFNIDDIKEELFIEDYIPSIGLTKTENPKYINSIIQCFAHIQEISDIIINIHIDQKYKNIYNSLVLTKAYRELLINLLLPKKVLNLVKMPYNPKKFINVIQSYDQNFQANGINYKEFINFMIYSLHDELNTNKKGENSELNISQSSNKTIKLKNENDALIDFLKHFNENNNSIIIKNIYGIIKNTLYCHKCQNSFYNYHCYSYIYFNLSEIIEYHQIKNNDENITLDLYDCLDYFQKAETLLGDNAIFCPNCKELNESTSLKNIYSTKNILIFIFDNIKENNLEQNFFDYTELINIRDYVEFKKGEKKSKEKFFLCGVVNFVEDNYGNETFIAFCRMGKNNDWYCYDNENIYPVTFQEIKNNGFPVVLFYHKLVKK